MTPNKRPILELPRSRFEKTMEALAIIGFLLGILLLFGYWADLPEQVPTHFNMSGEPDSWDSKWMIILPFVISIFLYTLLTFISRFPHRFNYICEITEGNAETQYRLGRALLILLKTELIWLFSIITWETIAVALGRCNGLGFSTPLVFITLITATIAGYLIKSSRAR